MRRQRVFVLFVFLSALSMAVHAQWLNFPTPGTPRTRDGKLDLTARTPRNADGKPDLSGVWMHEIAPEDLKRVTGTEAFEAESKVAVPGMEFAGIHKYVVNILADVNPPDSILTPAGVERTRQNAAADDPASVCAVVAGFPIAGLLSEPIKIVQAPKLTMILYELDNLHRQVFADGRSLPKEINFPAFLGYSIGHWERDVFVVETAGFNDKTALDFAGHPRSEGMHITERFHRLDFGHLDVQMTFEDPTYYTRPFTVSIPHTLLPDADIFEMFCENEKDRDHLKQP